jgi:hypothetical protein
MMFSSLNKQRNVTKLIQFTDGCSQYKSKSPFLDINNGKLKHLLWILKDMSGIYRGKGPADVCSRVVRSAISREATDEAGTAKYFCSFDFHHSSTVKLSPVTVRGITNRKILLDKYVKTSCDVFITFPAFRALEIADLTTREQTSAGPFPR